MLEKINLIKVAKGCTADSFLNLSGKAVLLN